LYLLVGGVGHPPTVTVTGPFIAIAGTVATIWPSIQLLTWAFTPVTATVLLDCAAPKLVPLMVILNEVIPVVEVYALHPFDPFCAEATSGGHQHT
jgi:hypothetical protein